MGLVMLTRSHLDKPPTKENITGLKSTDSPVFVTTKLSGLTDGKIPYHVNDSTGLADGPTKTDVDSAVSLKHPALTIDGTSPLSLSGQAISLKNDAAAAITEVDTGTLDNSTTKIPTNKTVYDAIAGGTGITHQQVLARSLMG